MNRSEPAPQGPRRAADNPPGVQRPPTELKRKEGMLTRFVDPYEMRAEPQPEEPGYGHGV